MSEIIAEIGVMCYCTRTPACHTHQQTINFRGPIDLPDACYRPDGKLQGTARRFGKGVWEVLLLRNFRTSAASTQPEVNKKKRVKGLEPSTTTLATWCSTN